MKSYAFRELFNPDIKNLFTLRQKVIYVYAALVMLSCFLAGMNRLMNAQYFLVFINGAVILALLLAIYTARKGFITFAALLLSVIILIPAVSVINNDISNSPCKK